MIAGLPRSGTSMVTGCLHSLGAWVGNTVPGGVGNPKGFFEHVSLREKLIKPLLTQLGCDPLGVRQLPVFNQVPRINGLRDSALSIIKNDGYSGDMPWAYKDAKLTLLWPLFIQAFPNARWIIVSRNPEDVIRSCLRTHFMAHHSQSNAFWRDFVSQYQARLTALKESQAQVYEISADNLISGNSDEILTLADSLGLRSDRHVIESFVDPNFWQAQA